MAATAIPTKKERGRPRSRQTNKAILKAAAEIVIASGLAEMTIEGVAERAGVGKASIYRRWPSKGALAFEAVVDAGATTVNVPDTVGYAMPHEFGAFLGRLYGLVPDLSGVVLSVHCHDDLGLAVANSFAGVLAGGMAVQGGT